MKTLRVWPFLFILLDGCIDPLPVHEVSHERALVVDGMITDQPGPYTVRLFWSSIAGRDLSTPEMVTEATVSISDDQDHNVMLTESENGIYVTAPDDLRGEVGRTYTLTIRTSDGMEFRSSEETMMAAGQVDTLYHTYERNAINEDDISLPQDAVSYSVDGRSDPSNKGRFLRWRSLEIYEIFTFPELRTRMENETRVPDPLPCSGYIFNNRLVSVDTCSCCTCWVYEYSRSAVVSPLQASGNNEFRSVKLAQVPVDEWRYFRRHYLEVEQLSISEQVYEFWKRVSAQHQGTGSLFQPNAVRVEGNIRCITDPEMEVFGVFAASAITRKSVFLDRGDIPRPLAEPPRITFDCRYAVDGNATNVKPPFW
jgi:hypothetical protein